MQRLFVPFTHGLQNVGNSCYVNASLQCLFSSNQVCDLLFEAAVKLNEPAFSQIADFRLFKALTDVFFNLWNNLPVPNHSLAMLIDRVCYEMRAVAGAQQDSHEFIICLLDNIERMLNYPIFADTQQRSPNIIARLFDIEAEASLHCGRFHHLCARNREQIRGLSLDLFPTLDLAIEHYFETQLVEGYNCLECRQLIQDGQNYDATINRRIIDFPEVLIIQLKRFVHENVSRLKLERSSMIVLFTTSNNLS